MRRKNRMKLSIIILIILLSWVGLIGIGRKIYLDSKEEVYGEIEQSFDKVLSMYPTTNLMDFYEMEGFRDSEFEIGDKGSWLLLSSMDIKKDEYSPLVSEGMLLRLNRNTRTGKGFYFHYEFSDKGTQEKKYPITYDEEGIHLVEEVSDSDLREKIENFQFFVQYASFKELNQNKAIRRMYNSEVPMYELEYQLTNEDQNVKELRKRYEIITQEAPTLLLKGVGDLDGSSVGYKTIEFTFDKKIDVFFTDSIDYQPTTEEDTE